MKDEIASGAIKTALTVFIASFVAYFSNVAAPLIVLLIVVVCDYITGMIKAYSMHILNSRIGFTGIIKKLSYFIVVAVGMICDYLLTSGLKQINANIGDLSIIAIIVIIWLIINELLSILENLSQIGVPLPTFLKKLLERLLVVTEKKGNEIATGKTDDEESEEEIATEEDYIEELMQQQSRTNVLTDGSESETSVPNEEENNTDKEENNTDKEQSIEDEIIENQFKGEM